MSKPDQPERTPAEEWAYLTFRLQGMLGWALNEAARLYPRKLEQLTNEQLAQEAKSRKALDKAAQDFMDDAREFFARTNGKTTQPKETKK